MYWSETTKKALRIMYVAHQYDVDKAGIPYVFHPFQVAQDMTDEDSVCAALLHDLIEDHPDCWNYDDLRKEGFSEEVISALKLLTHSDNEDYMSYIRRIASNEIARKVKLADLRQNMDTSRLNGKRPKKYDLYVEAYKYLTETDINEK